MKNILFPIALVVSALLLGGAGINHFIPETTFPNLFTPSDTPLKQPEFRKTTTKQFGGKLVVTYTADIASGAIGIDAASPVDDPYDNVFHFMLDEAPAASDKVWLCYDLNGVNDHTAVARSINTRQSVGGQLVATADAWSQQQECIDGAWLKRGDNVVRFSLPENAEYHYAVKDLRIVVEKTAGHAAIPVKKDLVVNQASTRHFGDKACLKGFISGVSAEKVQLFVGNTAVAVVSGEFEYVVEQPGQSAAPWYVDLRAVFPDGTEIRKSVVFDTDAGSGLFSPAAARGLVETAQFLPNDCGSLEAFGVSLELPEGAVKSPMAVSVTALRDVDLPALEPDMVNVTLGHKGFRFLPDGFHFEKNVHLGMPYDPALIPGGYTEKDIRTYYFDENDRRWKMTPFDSVSGALVISSTNHFTDYINGIIKVPESPQTQGYKPTGIKDLKVSDVSTGIVPIAPPSANNMGTANLSFPLKLPAGRHGMQPQLAIQYNSEGGNGWLGLGWDLSVPSISIDTRWDIPQYHPDFQSETYSLGGSMLSPNAHRNDWTPRQGPIMQFYPRIEQQYDKILRHGTSPKNYYWEVIQKDGTRNYYGGTVAGPDDTAVLKDNAGNIAQWFLREVRDPNDNYVRYSYTTVNDPGVPGSGEPGRQVYLKEIRYTGNGNSDGKYKITFTRDRELNDPKRPDVQINCRLGFKQVTADLLRNIEIYFADKLVRSYELLYEEGAFRKTRLSLVKENDQNNAEFYNHSFDYYDEVRNTAGHYVPYQPSRPWMVPNDGLDGGLLNPFPGFEDDITPIGGSTSFNYNVNGTISFGIGPTNDKLLTVNGHYGYTKVKNDGKVSLIDMTGDGLLDKVFCAGGVMYYEKNLGGTVEAFANRRKILNIDEFSHSETTTHNYGFGADFFAHISWDKSKSKTTTSVYLGDFNGDRLMDIVRNHDVWFNHLNGDGDPEFSTNSADTPNPIIAGTAIDTAVLAFDPAEQAILIEENPLHDVVRMWKPPYAGTITINAPVKLLEDLSPGAAQYLQKDGVRFTIEHSVNGQLWEQTADISSQNVVFTPIGPGLNGNTITVDTSDQIYFRVQSRFDGAYDQVLWNPEIIYTSIALPTIPNETDAQARLIHRYKASEDFVLGLGQKINMEYQGTLHIECVLQKPVTSDSITVQVFKTDSTFADTVFFLQQGYAWNETATMQQFSFNGNVERREQIHAYVKSATNVDWTKVDLKVKFHYMNAVDTANNTVVSNSEPLMEFNPTPGYTMFNYLMKKGEVFVAQDSGILKITPDIVVPIFLQTGWDKPAMGFDLTLSIKGVNKLYAIKTFPVFGDSIPIVLDPSIQAFIPANEPVWVEYHIARRGMADTIARDWLGANASFKGQDISASPGIFTTLSESEFIFGSMPRGWGQFAYYGNGALGQMPIKRALLKLNDKLKNPPSKQDMQSVDHPDELTVTYEPAKDTFIMMFPDAKRNRWLGFDESVWVAPDIMSSSRMGDDDVRLVFVPPVGSSNLQAPRLVSVSTTKSLSGGTGVGVGGFSAGYSGSESNTTSNTRINVLDIKGTGYPSIIGPDYLQLSTVRGGWAADKIYHGMGNHESRSASSGHSASAGYTGSIGKNTDTPSKGAPRLSIGSVSLTQSTGVASQSATVSASASVGISGEYNTTNDVIAHTWLDINGDGMVDKLYEDGDVQLNLGYRFTDKEKWNYEFIREGESKEFGAGVSAGVGITGPYSIFSFSFSGGVNVSKSESRTQRALQDVNGDGLIDIVEIGSPMRVRFNTGNGFTQAYDWSGLNELDKNKSVGEAANASFTACVFIPLWVITLKFCMTPGGSIGHGMATEMQQLMDIDGDGYPDVLRSSTDGELSVQSSTIGRTNLLKTVKRPMGSSFTMEYERVGNTYDMPNSKWVMAGLTLDDGLHGDGPDSVKTTFTYKKPQYDRRERDFYGFETVTTRQLDTDNNDNVYRTITQTYKNDNYYEKGLLISEIMYDQDGKPFTETVNTYELRDATTGGSFDPFSLDGRGFPALTETKKLFYEGDTAAGLSNRIAYTYDNTGNVVQYTDYGDGTPEDVLTAKIEYHTLAAPYILSMPKSIEVLDFGGDRLRYREAAIDGKGNVTQIRQYLDPDNAAVYDMVYEANGNLQKLTRPANANGERLFYEYTYDPEVQTYVTNVKDAYGYESQSAYDYAFGQVVESIDMNKQRIVYSLDAKGRIDTVVGPYELAKGLPFTIVNSYNPDAPVPYATTKHFDPANNGEIVTITFMDGLQRPVQVKKTGSLFVDKNQPDQPVMIVSGRVIFDAFGRTVKNYYPVTENIGGGNITFKTDLDGVPPTITDYDVLDRKTAVTLPDGAKTTSIYSIDKDNSGYTCFKTTETDPLNSKKETYIDIRNRTRAVKDEGPNGDIWTDFRYNLLSELLRVTDNGSNVTEYTYDQLGRRLSVKHPDAGRTEFEYDLVGNLIAKTTPNTRADNQSIRYTYDFERLVQIDYPKNYQNMVRYTYGKPGDKHHRAGRVWLQEDASGGQEYFFGPLGEVVKNIRTVLVSNLRLITYVSESRYDTWNRIDTMIYPDGEVVKYRYNKAGKLSGINSSRSGINTEFVGRLGYDKFEQRTFLRYGNGTETVYTYEDDRRRLQTMTVTNADGRTFMDNRYEYDAVGNILSLNNIAPIKDGEMGGPASYTYKYDELYRLTEASGNWTGPYSKESFTLDMQYDDLHNIRKKTQNHLRDGLTQTPTSYTQAYDYDQNRPHVPLKIGNLNYQFDANGNMTGWTEDITNRNRFIRWDEENRIRDIWEDGYVSQYTYDAGGERIVKSHGGMSIAYTDGAPAGMVNHRDNFTTYPSAYTVGRAKQLTKHYYIESQRFLSKIAAGDLKFLATDQIDSSYITAGNINYQGKMKLLAQAAVLGNPAPPTPDNPPHPLLPADEAVYQEGKPNQYWYNKPLETNDNVKAGFNLVPGSEQSYEANMYYYHPDHLGSTGYVTAFNGKLRQHVEYLPFGETFVEEHLNSDPAQPYLYNAKEYDAETRLYYYGARYYDPKLSIWVSVDPLAEKYPGWSPYNYTMLNPVKYVDPDGREIFSAIVEGTVAFGLEVGFDFAGSLLSGKDVSTAFQGINWGNALYEGGKAAVVSAVLPGASTTSKVGKLLNSPIGKLGLDFIGNTLKEINSDDNYDESGNLKISDVLLNSSISSGVSAWMGSGRSGSGKKIEAVKNNVQSALKKLGRSETVKQAENATKRLIGTVTSGAKQLLKHIGNEAGEKGGTNLLEGVIKARIMPPNESKN
ncbi:MAG: hypothetical protein IPK76_20560 [Lewinellaceae bacterium]|nr:hypothetical protein [Lewinellaceae bacterium]